MHVLDPVLKAEIARAITNRRSKSHSGEDLAIIKCEDKRAFDSSTEAKKASRIGVGRRCRPIHLHPYLCPVCGKFHLTSTHRRRRG